MVTAGELIEKLKRYPHDTVVTMSADEEGNHLKPIYNVGRQWYVKFEGSEYELECVAEDDKEDYGPDELVLVAEIW